MPILAAKFNALTIFQLKGYGRAVFKNKGQNKKHVSSKGYIGLDAGG